MARKKATHGGTRKGAGRPAHPLGVGVKTTIMIPEQLRDALLLDVELDERNNLSEAVIDRLIRGRRRGRAL